MKKKALIFMVTILLFTLALVWFSLYQTRKTEEEFSRQEVLKQEGEIIKPRRQLIPGRPEDYGMIVIDETNRVQTQKDWDRLLSLKIADLKSQSSPEVAQKIQEKIKEEPQVTQDKLKQIDEGIQKLSELLKKEPDNQELKERLEHLMMLRSIAQELPK